MKKLIYAITALFALASCGSGSNQNASGSDSLVTATNKAADSAVLNTVKEAYLYTLPLVLIDITRRQSVTQGASSLTSAPNEFVHLSKFPDATFTEVVRPNADTYYSTAILDLVKEPLVLSVPNTHGRYYMMPMLDAYSNVFSSPGTRTTGNGQHNFLITGPGWTGTVPAGMKEIPAPTNTVWIIGRTQVNSKEDGEKVVIPLQRQYKLTPLSAWGKTYTPGKPVDDPSVPKGFPNDIVKNMSLQEYLNYANDLLAKYPPPAADQPVLEKFASIGVGAGKKFDINALKADKATLEALPNQVMTGFLQAKSFFGNGLENGWSIARNGIGTYGTDYAKRAAVAFGGLGANLPEDAIYPGTSVDESGNTLNGSGKYVLHFDKGQEPPAKAFWSLTLYDKGGHFVDNPINRYAIGDRSHLKTNPDGSTDIYIQNVSPGKDKESNWLPAPAGEFNLLLRVYNPKPAMLDGSWKPGPVKKVS